MKKRYEINPEDFHNKIEKVEKFLKELADYNQKSLTSSDNKTTLKGQEIKAFINDTEKRLKDFKEGSSEAFSDYLSKNQSSIQILNENRVTGALWKSILLVLFTGIIPGLVFGVLQAAITNGNSFLLLNNKTQSGQLALKMQKGIIDLINASFVPFDFIFSDNRKFIVINGQPYYQSTGESGISGTWFPCIMRRGKAQLYARKHDDFGEYHYSEVKVPERLNQTEVQRLFTENVSPGYIVKVSRDFLIEGIDLTDNQIKIIDGLVSNYANKNNLSVKSTNVQARFLTKNDLMNSIRLGGGIWEDMDIKNKIIDLIFDDAEKYLLSVPLSINNDALFNTEEPDIVNQWLIKQGAQDIQDIFRLNRNVLTESKTSMENFSIAIADLVCVCEKLQQKYNSNTDNFWGFFRNENDPPYEKIHDELKVIKANLEQQINADLEKGLSFTEIIKGDLGTVSAHITTIIETKVLDTNHLSSEIADEIILECKKTYGSLISNESSVNLNI